MRKITPTAKRDLAYRRARDKGECRVYQFSPAHILVMDHCGHDHVEILTTTPPPKWIRQSKRMTRHEAEVAIRKSATIDPHFKVTYLAMIDAAKESEVAK